MEQSLSCEVNRFSDSEEIPRILWSWNVHHRVHNSPPQSPTIVTVLLQSQFLRWGVISALPKPEAGGPPLVGCPRLLIQYIRSYPSCLEAVAPSRTRGRAMPWWQGPTYYGWGLLSILNLWLKVSFFVSNGVGALRPERCRCCVEAAKVKMCADIRFLRLSKHIASFMTKTKRLVT
jgi:hypothetical protein